MAAPRRPLLLLSTAALLSVALIVSGQDPHGQLGGMYLYSNDIPWDVPAGAPIKGVLQKVKWPEIEPAPGRWNFTGFDAECAAGGQHGAIHLVFNTYAVPEWLYSAGVKKVEVLTDKGIEPFPHYTDAAYLQRVALVQQKLCEHMGSMPKETRPFEIFFDAGPTGDTMPWGGVPTNPALNITEVQFQQVLLTITRSFLDACPATPVMLNAGNPPYAPSDLAFFAKLKQSCPEVWYKGDRVGHGAFFNFEMQSYRLLHPLLGNGTVRSRAEGPESDAGWWTAAPAWGLRHLLSWALQFGLDYFNVHTEFAADSSNWAQLSWYNLWAGRCKQPDSTPGAFVIFHDGLDASDTQRSPVETFGAAVPTNKQRYLRIAQQFASQGARQDDPAGAAMADQSGQEHATALNDVGWDVWADDFSQWMSHLNASSNSVGRWRIGSPNASEMGYGRFGRSWKDGRSGLRLQLDPAMWSGKVPATVWSRVAFSQTTSRPWNEACWQLGYQQTAGVGLELGHPRRTLSEGAGWGTHIAPLTNLAPGGAINLSLSEKAAEAGCEVVFHSIEILKEKPTAPGPPHPGPPSPPPAPAPAPHTPCAKAEQSLCQGMRGKGDPCKKCVVKHAAALLAAGCFGGTVGGAGEKQFKHAFCKGRRDS